MDLRCPQQGQTALNRTSAPDRAEQNECPWSAVFTRLPIPHKVTGAAYRAGGDPDIREQRAPKSNTAAVCPEPSEGGYTTFWKTGPS